MPEETTRRTFLAAAGTGAAAALAGCAGNQPDETDTAEPTESGTPEPTDTQTATPDERSYTGGTLQMAAGGPIETLDPAAGKGSGAGVNQFSGALMTFPDGDLPPQPSLAESFEVSEDGTTYTWTLREDAQFHDGTDLTAEDFVYSWERVAGAVESRNQDDLVGDTFTLEHDRQDDLDGFDAYVPGSLGVEAVDEKTFRFNLRSPFTGTLSQLALTQLAPIPAGAVDYPKDFEKHGMDGLMYEGDADYQEYFSTQGDGPLFAGTGPFEVTAWSKGDRLELAAFDDYYGEGPYIDGITYTVIQSDQTQFSRFKNNNLDIINTIPTAQFDPNRRNIDRNLGTYRTGTYELDNGDTVNYGEAPALDTDYIIFNCARVEKPVRQAFAHIINQDRIASQVYKGLNPTAYHLTPPGAFMGENPGENYRAHAEDGENAQLDRFSDGYPYGIGEAQLDEATQVMEDAGYGPDNRAEVEFTIFSGASDWQSISQTIRDKAQSVYIDVNIVEADFGTIIGQALGGEMDMFSLGDGMEWPESDNFLRFIPPYDNPGAMFTRWSYQVVSRDVEFGGDDAESVASAVYDQLGGEFPEDHVVANADQNTVRVVIEDVSPDELAAAVSDAGYSTSGAESTLADFDPLMVESDRQWDRYLANRGPSDEEAQIRDEAYYFVEETNWEAVTELPLVHSQTQRLWRDRVNIRMSGTMEDQTFNLLTLEDQDN